jgi:ATP-binding cassette subfamily A (ABC1) protein 3
LGLDVNVAWWCLGLATPFYLMVYMYLDGIIPNAYGIRENLCFCCRRNKKPRFDPNDMIQQDEEASLFNPNPVSIKLINLTKRFGSFKAVDSLNFSVHSNEVLCLLGHNGAGKTTAINMLTGMLAPSSGDAHILGNSLCSDLSIVRQDIGLCQQFDILFERLTVYEHLKLVCELKCVPGGMVEQEIQDTMRLVMLEIHRNKEVNMLSGGMKRKLSLGMSLVGKSKVIILDEPTSGLDVDSRREVWELIKKVKQTRCVILST